MTQMPERRRYPRYTVWLPLRLTAVAGKVELPALNLLTQNISKEGVRFPAPRWIEPGRNVEVEVILAGVGPDGKDVHVSNVGYIVRIDPGTKPGWHNLAAEFREPTAGDKSGWHRLAAQFEPPPPSETDS